MNRNWDIMRNSANGADPYGTTRGTEQDHLQNRMRSRERITSRERARREEQSRSGRGEHGGGSLLGRMEQDIDRAMGNDWELGGTDEVRRALHPSLWDRVKGVFTGKGPRNWKRSDAKIHDDVCGCLTYHPHIDASDIEVTVEKGEVTLAGSVTDRSAKRLAEDIADGVRGVHDVHNRLRVQSR